MTKDTDAGRVELPIVIEDLREAGDKLVKKYQAAMLAASPEPPASDRLALVEAQGEEIEKLRADVRSMLRDIHCGGEWSDEHDDIRDRLRAGMGEDAKGDWRWWWKPHDDETFCTDHGARDEAIAAGFAAEPGADMIDIVEARVWSDGVDIEDDIEWFAEQRNAETVAQAALSNKDTGR